MDIMIILGIDPGLVKTGYGLIKVINEKYELLDFGIITPKKTDTLSIDAGWYRVHQITKCHMMDIKPDDYKFDRIEK